MPRAARADGACQPKSGLTTCIAADNLWPNATGPFTWLAPAKGVPPGTVAFALFASYVYRPIGLSVPSPDPQGTTVFAVEHALSAHLLASIGLSRRLTFDFDAPFILWQAGAGTAFLTGANEVLPRNAVGDVRFGPTVALLAHPGERGLDLAARLQVVAPTGEDLAFDSAGGAAFAPGLSIAYRLGRWSLGADAGARLRRYQELGAAVVGNQLSLGLGASCDALGAGWLTVAAELFALFDLEQQATETAAPAAFAPSTEASAAPLIPAEWLLTAASSHWLRGRLRAAVGIGGLVPTGAQTAVTAPALRAIATIGFSP